MKKVPDWSTYPIDKTCYGPSGVYIPGSWEFWPDMQTAYVSEVQQAIKLWASKGYEPKKEWIEFVVGKETSQ